MLSTLRHASTTISGHHQAVLIQSLSTSSATLIGSLVKRIWHVLQSVLKETASSCGWQLQILVCCVDSGGQPPRDDPQIQNWGLGLEIGTDHMTYWDWDPQLSNRTAAHIDLWFQEIRVNYQGQTMYLGIEYLEFGCQKKDFWLYLYLGSLLSVI